MSKESTTKSTHIVTGAAGFIGSHLVDRLLDDGRAVIGIDNFSRGTRHNLCEAQRSENFRLLAADCANIEDFRRSLSSVAEPGSIDTVWHLAANSDIPAGVASAEIDFRNTFLTTFNVITLMREFSFRRIAFASSSAIYGHHEEPIKENSGPLFPASNYGAMKLASEGMITAAVESHLDRAWIFRFPNVVGSRSTHGVIYDLLHKLQGSPLLLEVLGDGNQRKPYMHVIDLVDAMFYVHRYATEHINCVNIAAQDEGVTVRTIAEEVVRVAAPTAMIHYRGGDRGWIGDIPRFVFCTERLRRMGWMPKYDSRTAVQRAVSELTAEISA